jgi:glycosyltransferase involved in cell wall biosynthesis
MRVVPIVPAYQASRSVGPVVAELARLWPDREAPVIVVDDGSTDDTAEQARRAGALLERHTRNLGKGAALASGLKLARRLGARLAVTLDADGQHPPAEAARLALHPAPEQTLLLGVRNLERAGAPSANRFSNRFSNAFLSLFTGLSLGDTQCGLRRYPVHETLELGARSRGYGFEAEVILRAARAGWPIQDVEVDVIYPPEHERLSHFHVVRDPARIVLRVLFTFATAPGQR